jgi:putative membrane protein
MRNPLIFSAAAALAVSAAPALAQSMGPAAFVAAAGASDLYEQQSSQLVLQTTKDAKVRQFANMMISDHGKSTQQVKAAARQAGLNPGMPHLNPEQTQMIAQLRAATGPARDTAYVSQQKTAHQQAIKLHQDYAANGSAASLKAAASAIVPVVQHHIDMLQGM